MTTPPTDDWTIGAFVNTDPEDMNPVHRILWGLAGVLAAAITLPPAMVSSEQELARQTSLRAGLSTLIDMGTALDAERRGIMSSDSVSETLERQGYSPEAQQVLRTAFQKVLGPAEIIDLWRREVITEELRDAELYKIGWSGTNTAYLEALSKFKPGVQDVIQFAVREVFRPEIRADFELDADFPDPETESGAQLLHLFEQQGVDEETAKQYWAAHWTLPSVQQVFEMWHRTEVTNITEEDVDTLLLTQDTMRKWRQPLKDIAFRPITRVDIRRWHAVDMLNDDQLEERYRHVGFSAEDAVQMAIFTKRFNARGEADALEPFRSPLRTRAISLWRRGSMSDSDLRTTFGDLGYEEDQADTYMTAARFEREADRTEEIIRQLKPLYVRGFWSEEETITRLAELGFEAEELRVLLDEWTLARELREATESDRQERDLSKTDVLGAFRQDISNLEDTQIYLESLGYDDAEAQVLVAREQHRKETDTRTRIERGARALFLAGRNDRSATVSLLAENMIAPARIDVLLAEWDSERRARLPELTTAQIQKAYKSDLIDAQEAATRLDAKGYSPIDRDILISLAVGPEDIEESA